MAATHVDSRPPRNAPYPTSQVSGSASRVNLLRRQQRLPTSGYTTSSQHPALPLPYGPGPGDMLGGASSSGGGTEAAAAAQYVRNLKEQVGVLKSEVGMLKYTGPTTKLSSNVPLAVDVHDVDLVEDALRQGRHSTDQAAKASESLRTEQRRTQQIASELLEARQAAAAEKQAATDMSRKMQQQRYRHETHERERDRALTDVRTWQERVELLEAQLTAQRQELEASRRREQLHLAHVTGTGDHQRFGGNAEGGSAGAALAAGSDDIGGGIPLHVAQQIVGSHPRWRQEMEQLKAKLNAAEALNKEQTDLLDKITKSLEAKQAECIELVNSVRHEQQKQQLTAATVESDRLLLDDSRKEGEYLRAVHRSLCDDLDRLKQQNEHLFAKLRAETEERQLRDAHIANVVDGMRNLQHEGGKVHECMIAEQKLNESLQRDLQRERDRRLELERALAEERDRLRQLTVKLTDVGQSYAKRTADLEALMKQLSSQHQQAEMFDKTAHRSVAELLDSLRRDQTVVSSVIAVGGPHRTASPTGPAPLQPIPAPSAATAGGAAAGASSMSMAGAVAAATGVVRASGASPPLPTGSSYSTSAPYATVAPAASYATASGSSSAVSTAASAPAPRAAVPSYSAPAPVPVGGLGPAPVGLGPAPVPSSSIATSSVPSAASVTAVRPLGAAPAMQSGPSSAMASVATAAMAAQATQGPSVVSSSSAHPTSSYGPNPAAYYGSNPAAYGSNPAAYGSNPAAYGPSPAAAAVMPTTSSVATAASAARPVAAVIAPYVSQRSHTSSAVIEQARAAMAREKTVRLESNRTVDEAVAALSNGGSPSKGAHP